MHPGAREHAAHAERVDGSVSSIPGMRIAGRRARRARRRARCACRRRRPRPRRAGSRSRARRRRRPRPRAPRRARGAGAARARAARRRRRPASQRCRGSRSSGSRSPSRRSARKTSLEVLATSGRLASSTKTEPSRLQIRVQQAAQGAVAAAQQPLARASRRARLSGRRRMAPSRGPAVKPAARISARERREAARKLLVRLEPVADRALVAVVDLHDVEAQLGARAASASRLRSTSSSLTSWKKWYQLHQPARKGRAVRAAASRPCASPKRFEQRVRVDAERDAHALERTRLARARASPRRRCSTSIRTSSPSRRA